MAGAVEIRVRGRVQGVGFRPTVWRMAQACGLDGDVRNDAEGVLVRLCGAPSKIEAFRNLLEREPPPLAHIDSIDERPLQQTLPVGFSIVESAGGRAHTQISPDARICEACIAEIRDVRARRFGYALTNCTHCGPRLSIIRAIPYDRAQTTMAPFALCGDCDAEYRNPEDRRFHAEPTACPRCGPKITCRAFDGSASERTAPVALAAALLRRGEIVAVKGLGGYQLACAATSRAAVETLRTRKKRDGKPFALMARDLDTIRQYAAVSAQEEDLLTSPAAPIVVLAAKPGVLPQAVAPGLSTLGFMLPTTPLHVLLLDGLDNPLVMTSGNISDSPQIVDDDEAVRTLSRVGSHILMHDRAVANRIDDSVVRLMAGTPRLLRRARGYAPAPIALPPGFENAPDILALGAELKATFCLIKDGQAVLSQHQGDLEHPDAFDDYCKNLGLYTALFDHAPAAVAADLHPEYLSSKLAPTLAKPVIAVQHHHAHIASCLCENAYPLDAPPVLGIALDGLGFGADGALWGGEFLLADYFDFRRLAALKRVAMPGGARAVREPWRNLYAHVSAGIGWECFSASYASLDIARRLAEKPLRTLDAMMAKGINAPAASSCGRLFDAVAAALGLCFDAQSYEGEAASRLEALAQPAQADKGGAYCFGQTKDEGLYCLDPAPMWRALFDDIGAGLPATVIAVRFHNGLAIAVARLAQTLAAENNLRTIALSGGCFQNRLLLEDTIQHLASAGFAVLAQAQVPANDGGLSLGQGAVAAARLIRHATGNRPCA